MKKKLFFDIDGTLAYPGNNPNSETAAAIRQARRNGHKVLLCTGRTAENVPQSVRDIGFDGGIYSAGGKVVLEGELLRNCFMSQMLTDRVISLLQAASVFFALEAEGGLYNSGNGKDLLSQLDQSGSSSEMQRFVEALLCDPSQKTLVEYRGQPIYKIFFFISDRGIIHHLEKVLNGAAKVVVFENRLSDFPLMSGEISDPAIHKGAAMKTVCQFYGKTSADCIAFGDSMNDAEILAAAGLGIAMGNAPERVKELADLVCDSCENDGVAKALKELHLI